MSKFKKIAAAGAATAFGALAIATVPATSADAATTTLNATLTAGSLTISAPALFNYTSQQVSFTDNIFTSNIGTTQVNDQRGAASGDWTATASLNKFDDGVGPGPSGNEASLATYDSGIVTVVSNPNGTTTALGLKTLSPFPTGVAQSVVSKSGGSGTNRRSWDPTVAITLPVGSPIGTYSGTLTSSVS